LHKESVHPASAHVVALARDRGLLLNGPRPHCLRFMPALNSTADEVVMGLELLRLALRDAADGR
jgi:acetylornithine/N-succinyldiaminopimelate aminotransferase